MFRYLVKPNKICKIFSLAVVLLLVVLTPIGSFVNIATSIAFNCEGTSNSINNTYSSNTKRTGYANRWLADCLLQRRVLLADQFVNGNTNPTSTCDGNKIVCKHTTKGLRKQSQVLCFLRKLCFYS